MTAQLKSRHLPQILGVLLMLASFSFIGALLWSHSAVVLDFRPSLGGVILLVIGAIIYGAAGVLLAMAWRILLRWSGEDQVCWHESRRIYARTQIAKYVPGNVMQLLGRQVVGRQAGWSHVGLVLSSAFEMLCLLCVSSVIALVGLALTGMKVGLINLPVVLALLAALLAGAFFLLRFVPRIMAGKWPEISSRLASRKLSGLWPVGLLHMAFFLIGGLVLLIVCDVVLKSPVPPAYWPAISSLFAIGWTAGVITPGAPSGLGIREAVLVVGLSPVASPADAVLIAGLLRLLTVSGDVLFFLLGAPRLRGAPGRGKPGGVERQV